LYAKRALKASAQIINPAFVFIFVQTWTTEHSRTRALECSLFTVLPSLRSYAWQFNCGPTC